jgi:hypothetical protein
MAQPVHIRAFLKQIDLVWWPAFLLNEAHPPREYRSSLGAQTSDDLFRRPSSRKAKPPSQPEEAN